MYNLIGVKLFSKILYLFHQTTHNSIATNIPRVGNTAIFQKRTLNDMMIFRHDGPGLDAMACIFRANNQVVYPKNLF